jgi:hypothetical protein
MARRRNHTRSNRRPAQDEIAADVKEYQIGKPERFCGRVEEALHVYERDRAESEPRLATSLKQLQELRDSFEDFESCWRKLPNSAARLLAYNTLLGERGDGFDPTGRLTADVLTRLDATVWTLSAKLGAAEWSNYVGFADKGGQRRDIAAVEFLRKMANIYDREIRDEPSTVKPHKARAKTKKEVRIEVGPTDRRAARQVRSEPPRRRGDPAARQRRRSAGRLGCRTNRHRRGTSRQISRVPRRLSGAHSPAGVLMELAPPTATERSHMICRLRS